MSKKIIISILVYKEAKNIKKVIEEILDYWRYAQILIINDNSQDRTLEIIKELNNRKISFKYL